MGLTDPTEPYFRNGLWGHDGTQWRRLNLLWGFYDTLAETVVNLSATAGLNTLLGAAVPSGEIWVVRMISAVDVNTAVTYIRLGVRIGPTDYRVYEVRPGVAAQWSSVQCDLVLKESHQIVASMDGCVLNDDIYMQYLGYKMNVALG